MIKAVAHDIGTGPIPHKGSLPPFREPDTESVHRQATIHEKDDLPADDRKTEERKTKRQSFTQTLNKQLSNNATVSSSGKKTQHAKQASDQSQDVATFPASIVSMPFDGQRNMETIKGKHTISSGSLSTVGRQKTTQAEIVSKSSGGETASGPHKGPIKALVSLPETGKGLHLTESHQKQGKHKQSNTTTSMTRTSAKQATLQESAHTSKSNGPINTDKTLKDLAAHQTHSSQHNRVKISRTQEIPSKSAVTQSVKDAQSGKTAELLAQMDTSGNRPAQTGLKNGSISASSKQRAKAAELSAKIMKQASATQSAAKQTSALQAASASPLARSALSNESKDNRSWDMGMNSGTEWTIELNEATAAGRPMGATALASHSAVITKPLEPVPLGMQISQQIQASVTSTSTLDGRTLMVRLDPPELGRLSITFQEQDGVVTGLLEVSKAQTRYELQKTLPDIVQHLQASGIQVKRLDVTLAHSSDTSGARDGAQEDVFATAQDQTFEHPNGPYHESHQPDDSAGGPYIGTHTEANPAEMIESGTWRRDAFVADTGINLLI